MRRTIEITLRAPESGEAGHNCLTIEILTMLIERFPEFEGKGYSVLTIKAREEEFHPRISKLIEELWRLGKRPVIASQLMSPSGTLGGGAYSVIPMQFAESEDLNGESHLQMLAAPENGIGRYTRSRSNRGSRFWFLSPENLNPAKRFGYLNHDLFGCSESFRKELENSAFVGLDFTDPPLHPNPDFHPSDRLYFLTSTTILPFIKNSMYAQRFPESPVSAIEPYEDTDGTKGCFIGPDYRPPTLRFDAVSFRALGDFDIARTHECFGESGMFPRPKFIVSQRFRRWLDSQGLECTYHPIRLENPGDPEPDPPLAAICREIGMPLANVPG